LSRSVFDTLIITDLMKRSTRPKGTVRVTQRIALHDTQRIACTTRNALRYAIYTQRVVLCDIHATCCVVRYTRNALRYAIHTTRCVVRYTRNALRYAIYTQRVVLCVQLLLTPSTLAPFPRFTRCALAWAFNGNRCDNGVESSRAQMGGTERAPDSELNGPRLSFAVVMSVPSRERSHELGML